MKQKQLHVLFSTTFNSFHRWVDIMLTKDASCTLINVVITDPTRAYLFPWSYATQRFVASDITQTKERSYCNWHPTNQFLLLAIEVFGCLHKHDDVFLCDCANAIWSLKGIKGLHISTLVTFLLKFFLITLQRMQKSSILSWVIVVGLAISWLPPLQDTPVITMVNLLLIINY